MGLLRWMTEGGRVKDGVRGEAVVLAIHPPTTGARSYQMEGELLVAAPGREPYETTRGLYVPARKWPMPGSKLPVIIDRDDPERVQILWDELPERPKEQIQRDLDEAVAADHVRPRADQAQGRREELHRLFDDTSRSEGSGMYMVELTKPPSRVDAS